MQFVYYYKLINFIVNYFLPLERIIVSQDNVVTAFMACYRAEVRRQHTNWYPRITVIPVIYTEGLIEIGIHRGAWEGPSPSLYG